MRDALSIMDQAIASAPTAPAAPGEANGIPTLSADEIRTLMGTVSNVVFEQILAAVHANNSADVLAILGRLLDAGNGPQPLARQFVRYLRNCTLAKITNLQPDQPAHGLAADLLQISPEERSRAARSAALFTEEELSRFLSILLRTFDDLGYRQEPRFHLELGVLKLVHLQRLLPVEDLLSQLGATKSPPTPVTAPTNLSAPSSTTVSSSAKVGSTTSPTVAASSRPGQTSLAAASVPTAGVPSEHARGGGASSSGRVGSTDAPTAKAPSPSTPIRTTTTDGSLALAPEPASKGDDRPHLVESPTPQTTPDLEALQSTLVSALAAVKGQQSASDAIHDATLTLADDTVQIQTAVSKAMLPTLFNADADRILKATLRQSHPNLKLALLTGTPAAAAPKKKRAAASGSAAELAENHPMVKEAKRLFSAEISNVIDLRDKD
jgi:DNA polymerase-3 subunit gamma/tau